MGSEDLIRNGFRKVRFTKSAHVYFTASTSGDHVFNCKHHGFVEDDEEGGLEYYCGAFELMALVGRAPGRIFVLESSRTDYLRTDDVYCFEKDLDGNNAWNGGVNVTRELKLSDLDDLDDTDTFLLYNGENHYDSFVPYEGVELQPVEE